MVTGGILSAVIGVVLLTTGAEVLLASAAIALGGALTTATISRKVGWVLLLVAVALVAIERFVTT